LAPSTAPLLPGLRFNLSPSLPRGVYLLTPLRRAPRPGDLVLACPPEPAAALARRRGYLDPGPCPGGTRPLGKLVLAAAGDRLDLPGPPDRRHAATPTNGATDATDATSAIPAIAAIGATTRTGATGATATALALNRCRLPAIPTPATDTRGRPLPRLPAGTYLVRPGEIWLFSPHPRSFDSRCFGPVPVAQVRGLLHPLLIAGREPLRRWAALLRDCAPHP
jgi:type IV secretory pathway protease TraF